MVTPDVDMNNTYWALKNKFKLEVGVENNIDSRYPELCWFKQGIYCFTSLSMSNQTSNFTITLQGKDKTCLLNGDLGGIIAASTDFGQLEEQTVLENGEYIIDLTDIPIKTIIRNAVHFFAGEPLENIIINDVDDYGLELLEYRVNNKYLYLPRRTDTGEVANLIIDEDKDYLLEPKEGADTIKLKDIPETKLYNSTDVSKNKDAIKVYYKVEDEWREYQIIRIEYGDTAGYRLTELTYAGELVANVGESLVTVLDKIKNMFSSFEYFYDIDGRFIFQKKKTYQNNTWTPLNDDGSSTYAMDAAYTSSAVYQFENNKLITACSNQPNILNFKNDYSIWGKRTSVSGEELPIHLRYAIESKPKYYVSERREKQMNDSYEWVKRVFINEEASLDETTQDWLFSQTMTRQFYYVDWREIIYQMALDYYNLDEWLGDNDYTPTGETITYAELLMRNNPNTCPRGRTGYEIFYTDQRGFWRQLYFPGFKYPALITLSEMRTAARWVWFNTDKKTADPTKDEINKIITDRESDWLKYYEQDFNTDGFAKNMEEAPEVLNYYFDFMDTDGAFGKYAISSIGDRVKAINDDKVTSIYFKETPTVLFMTNKQFTELKVGKTEYLQKGYTIINLTSQMENYFTISAQGKSAWDELQTQMYQYTNFAESITLTAVPIYYLEPNNRILVKNDAADINGEYIVTTITVPLAYNGTTSITATKAVERIY